MSDKRAIVAIGGSITAVVMIMGIFSLLPTVIAVSETTPYAMYGHATLRILDSDGNIKAYIQTDNAPLDLLKNCTIDHNFATTLAGAAGTCKVIVDMAIGDDAGGAPPFDDNALALTNEYTTTGKCTAVIGASTAAITAVTNDLAKVTLRCNVANGNEFTIAANDVNTSTAISCTLVVATGNDECDISEVGIFDATGAIYARSSFGPSTVTAGDKVEMDYETTVK